MKGAQIWPKKLWHGNIMGKVILAKKITEFGSPGAEIWLFKRKQIWTVLLILQFTIHRTFFALYLGKRTHVDAEHYAATQTAKIWMLTNVLTKRKGHVQFKQKPVKKSEQKTCKIGSFCDPFVGQLISCTILYYLAILHSCDMAWVQFEIVNNLWRLTKYRLFL